MGKIITIEGADGTGKTTQAKLLVEYLKSKNGIRVGYMSFPDYGSEICKIIEMYQMGKFGDPKKTDPIIGSLPYAIDRFNMKEHITDWLKDDKFIWVFNRYCESNFGYQCAKVDDSEKENLQKKLKFIEQEILGMPMSDLVLFLNLNVAHAKKAMIERDLDLNEEDITYQREVLTTYRWLAKKEDNWRVIECDNKKGKRYDEEKVFKALRNVVDGWLSEFF